MTKLFALDFNDVESQETIVPLNRQQITEVEYWEKYYHDSDVTYEWNNGYLEEKAVSDVLTISMYKCFFELLEHYLRTNPVAQSVLLEMGFRLMLPNSIQIRRPDLGVVLNNNPVPLLPNDNSYQGIFDLCVEALSESYAKDIKRDTVIKKGEYAAIGVKEYYILDGHHRYTEFYRLNAQNVYVPIKLLKGGIIQSKVLPGFQFRMDDLYHCPSPEEMIQDNVYKSFVLPGYSEAKQRYSEAKQQLEEAQTEIARLKALLAS